MKRSRVVAAVLLGSLLLSGCGDAASPPAPPATPASPSPARPSPTRPVDDLPMPTKPGPTTLSGTVVPGVEANCLLLDGYLLVGGDRSALRAGARVTVTGQVRSDLVTTCQQGTPFQVETVAPG